MISKDNGSFSGIVENYKFTLNFIQDSATKEYIFLVYIVVLNKRQNTSSILRKQGNCRNEAKTVQLLARFYIVIVLAFFNVFTLALLS